MGRWAQSIRRGGVGHGDTQNSDPTPDPAQFTIAPIGVGNWLITYETEPPPGAPAGSYGVEIKTGLVSVIYTDDTFIVPAPGSQSLTPTAYGGPGTTVYCITRWVDNTYAPVADFSPEFTLVVL